MRLFDAVGNKFEPNLRNVKILVNTPGAIRKGTLEYIHVEQRIVKIFYTVEGSNEYFVGYAFDSTDLHFDRMIVIDSFVASHSSNEPV